jgi:hypothetical protein
VRNLAEDNAGLALQQEESTGTIHSRTTYPHIALDRGGRFTEGNRCFIRLSYGAVAQEDSALRSTTETGRHAVQKTAAHAAL